MNDPDEWFEVECPIYGVDFDILDSMPYPGDEIHCIMCGGTHIASVELGRAFEWDKGCINDEWQKRVRK